MGLLLPKKNSAGGLVLSTERQRIKRSCRVE
jgi:hypothetical protein